MQEYRRSSECGVVPVGFGSVQHKTDFSELAQSIMDLDTSGLVPFPPFDGSEFRRLIDRDLGFEP
jgi:hypothetical protein